MLDFVVGLALGFVADVLWSKTPGVSEEEIHAQSLNARWDRLHIVEHYHWGIALMAVWLILPWDWLLGIAAALFASEWTGDMAHPFAVGKTHFRESTYLGIVLAVTLSVMYLLL